MRSFLRRTILLTATFVLAPLALAAQSPAEIFQRYNRAVDPENRLSSYAGVKITAQVEMAAMGMLMNNVTYAARPNLLLVVVEIPGMGEMRQGYDGTTAWAIDPNQGPRILMGAEAAQFTQSEALTTRLRHVDDFATIVDAGEIAVGTDKAKCLTLTRKAASSVPVTECYSSATGLIVEARATTTSPMGEIQITQRMADYKAVGGILLPHVTTSDMMGQQLTVTVKAVEFGPQNPSLFALPDAIKALPRP